MKRNTTVLVLCGLLFLADCTWLRLMLDKRESLAGLQASIAFIGETLLAATLAAVVYLVLRKSMRDKSGSLDAKKLSGGFSPYAGYSYLFGLRRLT